MKKHCGSCNHCEFIGSLRVCPLAKKCQVAKDHIKWEPKQSPQLPTGGTE